MKLKLITKKINFVALVCLFFFSTPLFSFNENFTDLYNTYSNYTHCSDNSFIADTLIKLCEKIDGDNGGLKESLKNTTENFEQKTKKLEQKRALINALTQKTYTPARGNAINSLSTQIQELQPEVNQLSQEQNTQQEELIFCETQKLKLLRNGEQTQQALTLLRTISPQENAPSQNLFSRICWKDLQISDLISFLTAYTRPGSGFVETEFGTICMIDLLANPPTDHQELEQNLNILKALQNDQTLCDKLNLLLKQFSLCEAEFLTFASNISKEPAPILQNLETLNLLQNHKFRFYTLGTLQTSLIKPTLLSVFKMGCFKDFAIHFTPAFLKRLAKRMLPRIAIAVIKVPLLKFVLLGGSFLLLKQQVTARNQAIEMATTQTQNFHVLLKIVQEIYDLLKTNETLAHLAEDIHEILEQTEKSNNLHNQFEQLINLSGNQQLIQAFWAIGKLDTYLARVKLTKQNFCLVEYSQSPTPLIELENNWNPLVDTEKRTTYNFSTTNQNTLLQDPEELKTLAISILFAHLGIAPATKAIITPFACVQTAINPEHCVSLEIAKLSDMASQLFELRNSPEKLGLLIVDNQRLKALQPSQICLYSQFQTLKSTIISSLYPLSNIRIIAQTLTGWASTGTMR